VISRYAGALVRAFLVVVAVTLPSVMLRNVGADTAQIVALVGLFGGALTFFEYASVYPGLIEFRDAPPLNRLRFISFFGTVLILTLLVAVDQNPSTLNRFIDALSGLLGRSLDFPYSPVRLLVLVLPPDADPAEIKLLRAAGGAAYVISLCILLYFVLYMRLARWPFVRGGFNVWVNLPTFDPTSGGDVVERLRRDAWFNVSLGFLLPFLIPGILKLVSVGVTPVSLASTHTMIWTVTAWAFLPTSLVLRGLAMGRIATLIEEKRRTSNLRDEYQPA